jgi:hypothetical protein
MSVTGTVRIDLTHVPRDRQRHRAAALVQAPDGAAVELIVGALAVEPEALRVLREHRDRLRLDVHGEPHAVRRWLDALRRADDLWPVLP